MEPTLPTHPYISSTEASKRFGITNDYVGALCRQGKVRGALVGRLWYVHEDALRDYLEQMERQRAERNKLLSKSMRHAWTMLLVLTVIAAPQARAANAPGQNGTSLPDMVINATQRAELSLGDMYWQVVEAYVATSYEALDAAAAMYNSTVVGFVNATYAARDLSAAAYGGIAGQLVAGVTTVHEVQMTGIAILGQSMSDGADEVGAAYSAAAAWVAAGNSKVKERLNVPTAQAQPAAAVVADAQPAIAHRVDEPAPAPTAAVVPDNRTIALNTTASSAPAQPAQYVTQEALAAQLATLKAQIAQLVGAQTAAVAGVQVPQQVAAGGYGAVYGAASAPPASPTTAAQVAASLTASDIPALNYFAATSTISIAYGGTGTSTVPSANQLMLADANGNWEYVGTSSLGITGGGSSQWTTSGSNIYYTTGNVGVGTSSPYSMLAVAGQVVGQNFIATSTTATSTFAGGFSAAGTSGLTVLQNGNVGINSANPAYGLTVNNTSLFTNFPQVHAVSGDATPIYGRTPTDGLTVGAWNVSMDATTGDLFHLTTASNTANSRTVTDATLTNGSAVITSATAQFSAGVSNVGTDLGMVVTGAGIPSGTTIVSVQSVTQATLSANATVTGSNVTVTIGAGPNPNGALIAMGVDNGATGLVVRNKYQGIGINLQQLSTVAQATSYGMIATQASNLAPLMRIQASTSTAATLMQFVSSGQAMNAGTKLVTFDVPAVGGSTLAGQILADTGNIDWRRTIQTVAANSSVTPIIRVADEATNPTETYIDAKTNNETGLHIYHWSGSTNLMYSSGWFSTTDRLKLQVGNGAQVKGAETMSTLIEARVNATPQMAFFGATPVAQPAATTDLRTALINLGLLASGGATPLNLNGGALTVGSNGLTVGTSQLVVTSGNVGVGSTSPWAQLSVNTTAGSPAFAVGSSTGTQFIVDKSGNVGVGTAAPSLPLDVQGTATVGIGYTNLSGHALMKVNGAVASQAGYYIYKNGVEKVQIAVLGNTNDLSIAMAGTDRLHVASGGNVGIGNSSPSYLLDVAGLGHFTGLVDAANFVATSSSVASIFKGGFLSLASSTIGSGTQVGGLTISGGATTTGNAYVSGSLTVAGGISFGDFNVDSNTTCGNQYHTFIGSIGTVGGDECAALNVTQADAGGNVIYRFGGAGQAWAGEFYANSTLVGMNTKGGLPLSFQIGQSEKMRVDSNGNVGVGTSTPGSLLSVSGVANFTAATSTFYSTGGINLSGGCFAVNGTCVGGSSSLTGSTGQVPYFTGTNTAAGTSTLYISTAGKVGVGTTGPAAALHVFGAQTNPGVQSFATTSMVAIGGNSPTGYVLAIGQNTSNNTWLQSGYTGPVTAYTNLLLQPVGGNVGIGTTTPGSKLSVSSGLSVGADYTAAAPTNGAIFEGNVGIGTNSPFRSLSVAVPSAQTVAAIFNTSDFVSAGSGTGLQVLLGASTGDTYGEIDVKSNGLNSWNNLVLQSGGGNVGVGTTSPSSILAVSNHANDGLGTTVFAASTNAGYGLAVDNKRQVYVYGKPGTDRVFDSSMHIKFDASSGFTAIENIPNADSATYQRFFNSSLTAIGSITESGTTGTAFNTVSDRRIKEHIATTTLGLADLMKIAVETFSFINDSAHATTTGFIAQNIEQVFPAAVTTNGDDGISPLGATSTPWAVDYGRITPLIVKAVQDIANLSVTFKNTLIAWLGDASNGIGKLFAREVHTQQLCVGDGTGAETCVTKAQLDELLRMNNLAASAAAATATAAPSDSAEAATSTPAAVVEDNASSTPALADSVASSTPADAASTTPMTADTASSTPQN